ncbi:radical SAM protein, partial [Candidatus Peregrinibacteria bacterium]|nr:radical SAM protein [Candidatus Peregrinibacteria bacterium]
MLPVKTLVKAITRYLQAKIYDRPFAAHLGVTDTCNLSCDYCNLEGKARNPTLEQLAERLDLLDNLGIAVVWLMGKGEPTLRDDLDQIIAKANKRALFTGITTNGSILTKEVVTRYAAAGLNLMEISVDTYKENPFSRKSVEANPNFPRIIQHAQQQGVGCILHSVILPQQEAVEDARRLLDFCKEYNVPITFGFMFNSPEEERTPYNQSDLEPLLRLLEQEAKPGGIVLNFPSYFTKGQQWLQQPIEWSCEKTLVVSTDNHIDLCSRLSGKSGIADTITPEQIHQLQHTSYPECEDCFSSCGYQLNMFRTSP